MSQVYNLEFEELAIYDLDNLFGLMSSYIHQLSFDDVGFDLQAGEIAKLLDKFEILVANNTVTSEEGVKRFWFAKVMFQIMTEASAYLKYYQIRGTDQFLVRRVIQFNVGLLAFFDPIGIPDVLIPDYQISLQTFARILETWEKMFVNLDKIPLGVGQLFTTEITKATATLEFLILRSSKDWAYIENKFVKNLLESLGN